MKSKKLYEAMNYVDDWYLDIADTPVKEHQTMKRKHFSAKKAITYALAAAICISLLTVTAAATGLIPGIFKTLQEQLPEEKELFQAAAEANTEQVPEVVELPKLDMSKLTLFERYYDGETILLGYNLDAIIPKPVVGYVPDTELLAEIKGTQECDSLQLEQELQEKLSPEEYAQYQKHLRENGSCCVVFSNVFIGDHKYVNGVDSIEGMTPDAEGPGMAIYPTENGECLHLSPLPEEGRNQESVTVDLKLRASRWYYYMESDGHAYQMLKQVHEESVSFVLENVNG